MLAADALGFLGPALLLLHGAMLDTGLGVWHDVTADLARDHRLYVVDLPRHGGSRPWRGMLDDRFYRRFVGDLLDELGLGERFAVSASALIRRSVTGLSTRATVGEITDATMATLRRPFPGRAARTESVAGSSHLARPKRL